MVVIPAQGREVVDFVASRQSGQAKQETFEGLLAIVAPMSARILDAPVGTVRFLEIYTRHGHRAIGINVSSEILAQATQKHEQLHGNNVTTAGRRHHRP